MNENAIERALSALSKQRLKAPTKLTEEMMKTARRLDAERLRQSADKKDTPDRSLGLSSEKPKKGKERKM